MLLSSRTMLISLLKFAGSLYFLCNFFLTYTNILSCLTRNFCITVRAAAASWKLHTHRDTPANQSCLLFKTGQSLSKEDSRMHAECQPVLEGSGVQGWPLLLSLCVTTCTSLRVTSPDLCSPLERSQPSHPLSLGSHRALEEPCWYRSSSCPALSSMPGAPRVMFPSQDSKLDGC